MRGGIRLGDGLLGVPHVFVWSDWSLKLPPVLGVGWSRMSLMRLIGGTGVAGVAEVANRRCPDRAAHGGAAEVDLVANI